MKKSLVTVSVIVAAGAAWTGASWFTGKLIEQQMDEAVNNTNRQLQDFLPKTGLNWAMGMFRAAFLAAKSAMCCALMVAPPRCHSAEAQR